MGFKRFSLMIAIRTAILMLSLILFAYVVIIPGYHAASLLIAILLIAQCIYLYHFISRTNAELTRFLESARYADYSQRFELEGIGAGFGELGSTFSDILKTFQENRTNQEQELRHLKAIIEHVPVPIISIQSKGVIKLWNNSARRLFGTYQISRVTELSQFGEDFAHHLQSIAAGERRLVNFEIDDMEQQLTVSATEVIFAGKQEKLLSMLNIQTELDGVQLQAWQDLVRVLTHEIMNSITPVASLSKTAVDLVEDAKSKILQHPEIVDELEDASSAVKTVARRSEGLMNFVSSYRRLTRLPPANKAFIKVKDLFSQTLSIATQQWSEKSIDFTYHIEPLELDIQVDRDMIEQILINLLQNAEQAVSNIEHPHISLTASLNRRGHVVIDIADNGPGVADELARKIFVPFFTTKRQGSGVGLALTRQIMSVHGGTVKLEQSESGGALFRLTF